MDTARFDIGVVLSRWKQDNADVAISTAIVAGDTDTPLIRWSKSAAALVVGRPARAPLGIMDPVGGSQ